MLSSQKECLYKPTYILQTSNYKSVFFELTEQKSSKPENINFLINTLVKSDSTNVPIFFFFDEKITEPDDDYKIQFDKFPNCYYYLHYYTVNDSLTFSEINFGSNFSTDDNELNLEKNKTKQKNKKMSPKEWFLNKWRGYKSLKEDFPRTYTITHETNSYILS